MLFFYNFIYTLLLLSTFVSYNSLNVHEIIEKKISCNRSVVFDTTQQHKHRTYKHILYDDNDEKLCFAFQKWYCSIGLLQSY